MAKVVQFKRGNSNNFNNVQLAEGEPAFLLDKGILYIGDGSNNIQINFSQNELIALIDARIALLCGGTNYTYYLLTNGNIDNPALLFTNGDIVLLEENSADYDTPVTNGNNITPAVIFVNGEVLMSGPNYSFEYITNGNIDNPAILFANADILEMEVS